MDNGKGATNQVGAALLQLGHHRGVVSFQSPLLVAKRSDVNIELRNPGSSLISLTLGVLAGTLGLSTTSMASEFERGQ